MDHERTKENPEDCFAEMRARHDEQLKNLHGNMNDVHDTVREVRDRLTRLEAKLENGLSDRIALGVAKVLQDQSRDLYARDAAERKQTAEEVKEQNKIDLQEKEIRDREYGRVRDAEMRRYEIEQRKQMDKIKAWIGFAAAVGVPIAAAVGAAIGGLF